MTQTELIKKLSYPGVINDTFFELTEKAPEALGLMDSLLDPDKPDNLDVLTICRHLVATIVSVSGPVLDSNTTIHLVASALLNGFLQGAIAAHKIIETEELERIGKL